MNKEHNKELKLNFIENNIVYIHGIFDESISTNIVPQLYNLVDEEKKKKEGKIIIDISSYGGYTQYLHHILGILENAKSHKIIIETRALSYAYSCGSMLACFGTKGHRLISKTSEHLCHLGAAGVYARNDIEIERQTERVKEHFNFVRDHYKKYAKILNLEKVIRDDSLFIRGQQIIDWGLADEFY